MRSGRQSAELVQAKLVQSFENAHQLAAVSRPLDQLTPEFRLEIGIRAFQIGRTPSASDGRTHRAAGQRQRRGDRREAVLSAHGGQSATPADAVAALNRAFAQVAEDMVRWTVAEVGKP